jgi:negative regulator of replication initiation
MPQESLWVQFSVVAILALVIIAIWRELKNFSNEQDTKRDTEREKQRVWQETQDAVRDQRWQEFLESMQNGWMAQDGRNNETIKDMIRKMEVLITAIHNHDQFTREAIASMRERTSK